MLRSLGQVISGDFRDIGVCADAQVWLKKIEVLNKKTKTGDDVKIDYIEKVLHITTLKNDITTQYIAVTNQNNERGEPVCYAMSFKSSSTHAWIGTVYAVSIYELFVKGLLFVYGTVKSRKRLADAKE